MGKKTPYLCIYLNIFSICLHGQVKKINSRMLLVRTLVKRRNTLEKYINKSIKNNMIIEKKISIKREKKFFGKKEKKKIRR